MTVITVVPYAARKTGTVAFAAANFPALKHFWHKDDITDNASATWTDRVGSFALTLAGANKWRKDANGVYGNTAASTFSGALANFTTKHAILFARVGELTSTNQHFGFYDIDAAGTTGYLQLRMRGSGGAEHYAGVDQLNFMTYSAWAGVVNSGPAFGMTYYNGTSTTGANSACYRAAGRNNIETTNGVATGVSLNSSATTTHEGQVGAPGVAEANCYHILDMGIMVFSSTPPDLPDAAAYMRDNPGKIFPGWYGLV